MYLCTPHHIIISLHPLVPISPPDDCLLRMLSTCYCLLVKLSCTILSNLFSPPSPFLYTRLSSRHELNLSCLSTHNFMLISISSSLGHALCCVPIDQQIDIIIRLQRCSMNYKMPCFLEFLILPYTHTVL